MDHGHVTAQSRQLQTGVSAEPYVPAPVSEHNPLDKVSICKIILIILFLKQVSTTVVNGRRKTITTQMLEEEKAKSTCQIHSSYYVHCM